VSQLLGAVFHTADTSYGAETPQAIGAGIHYGIKPNSQICIYNRGCSKLMTKITSTRFPSKTFSRLDKDYFSLSTVILNAIYNVFGTYQAETYSC
jgi:hypothetical protein